MVMTSPESGFHIFIKKLFFLASSSSGVEWKEKPTCLIRPWTFFSWTQLQRSKLSKYCVLISPRLCSRFPAMFAYQPFFLVNCAVASSLVLQLIHAVFLVCSTSMVSSSSFGRRIRPNPSFLISSPKYAVYFLLSTYKKFFYAISHSFDHFLLVGWSLHHSVF